MIDIVRELSAIRRETGQGKVPAGEGNTVVLRRTYAAAVEDVWDALTTPERLRRWFLPVTGEFRVGGQFQVEGNAGGEILDCEPPRHLGLTWVFGPAPDGPPASVVHVRLTPADEGATEFELEHTAIVDPDQWSQYGPGAVGVGWDMALFGLGLHLRGESIGDPAEWESAPAAREFMTGSSAAWGQALGAAGADAEQVARAVENTTGFYVPAPSD